MSSTSLTSMEQSNRIRKRQRFSTMIVNAGHTSDVENNNDEVPVRNNRALSIVDLALQNLEINGVEVPRIDRSTERKSSKTKAMKRAKTFPNGDAEIPCGKTKRPKQAPVGDCPICFDTLGKNQLASTKCGHVFCLSCLKKALKVEKKCPTCRGDLKSKKDYHPLFLSFAQKEDHH